jgi:AraC family transcriptional activator of tynA and feaB
VRMSPIIARKTKSDIALSAIECIYGNFILSGELRVDQGDTSNLAKPGDLILYHSFSPVTLTESPDSICEDLAFSIPRSQFAAIPNAEDHFHNCLLLKGKLIDPLSTCLASITQNLRSSSADELSALFDACVSLLPLAAGCFGEKKKTELAKTSHMLSEVLDFIGENISDPNLSPQLTAEHIGVSIRYIHKLFAHSGTTFSSYVTAERLENIRWELTAFSGRRAPISLLAYRWGFSDLSTFNRAFKHRFGFTPSHFREA